VAHQLGLLDRHGARWTDRRPRSEGLDARSAHAAAHLPGWAEALVMAPMIASLAGTPSSAHRIDEMQALRHCFALRLEPRVRR